MKILFKFLFLLCLAGAVFALVKSWDALPGVFEKTAEFLNSFAVGK